MNVALADQDFSLGGGRQPYWGRRVPMSDVGAKTKELGSVGGEGWGFGRAPGASP